VLVESRTQVLLYGTGPRFSASADAGGRIILPYLRWRGIDGIDLLVVSHLDSDHSGGAASVLSGTRVAAVLTSIDPAHPALPGHFPGDPVVPGVVLLDEGVGSITAELEQDVKATGVTVRSAKFLRPVRPGEELEISLAPEGNRTVRFECRAEGAPAVTGVVATDETG